MSDTTIDDLFDPFNNNDWLDMHTLTGIEPDEWLECMHLTTKAKSALYELMLSVIGEDDKLTHNVDTVEWIKNERNQLRQEQRNKLKELMK